MGTHPIFESDFDCLTEMLNISVGDVWQLAAEISSNLERLTNEIGLDKVQGVVTPTVRALELLEKLAEERSKLIEDKLIADQVIESMKKSRETSSESDNSILAEKNGNTPNQNSEKKKDENKKHDELQAFLERTIQQKNEENLKLAKTIAENKVTEGNRAHELQRQRQVMSALERRVTELSDDLRIKECTINELENDCDTLENEANRLLTINRELRIKLGSDDVTEEDLSEITSEFTTEKSFASEITENLSNATESQTQTQESTPEIERLDENERPGPEGEEKEEIDSLEQRQEDETKPRYTLFELEEVLNEKNKYKERCFVLEEKLRDITGDETITWQGLSTQDLESVETSGGGHYRAVQSTTPSTIKIFPGEKGSIRNFMTKFFRSPATNSSANNGKMISPTTPTYVRSDPVDAEIIGP